MRYIQSFSTSGTEQEAIDNNLLGKPYVALIHDGHYIDWNSNEPTPPVPPEPVYSAMPLTFDFICGGTVYFDLKVEDNYKTFGYKINNGEWISPTSNTFSFEVNNGDKVAVKGSNEVYGIGTGDREGPVFSGSSSVLFNIYGNLMSIIDYNNFTDRNTLSSKAFMGFLRYSNVVDASNLIFPATDIVESYTFQNFFRNCENLEAGPKVLPAYREVGFRGYKSMFEGCNNLRTAPTIAAIEWGTVAAEGMFYGCYNLTNTPQLTITSEDSDSFHLTFFNCSSLTRVDNIVFPEELLDSHQMFGNCSNISYIKCLSKNINVHSDWLRGVAASGTFVKHPDAVWSEGTIPTGWTVIDADI